jgi:glycine cleavage system H protein
MIPVTLPIMLMLFLFLILIGVSMLLFIGSNYVSQYARSNAVRKLLFGSSREQIPAHASLAAATETAGPVPRVEGYSLPQFLRYHCGHTWVAFKETGEAIVGIDEFAAKLIGAAKIIASPRIGQSFRQDEQGWILRRKGKDLRVQAPLDGQIVAVNERVLENPELLSTDPYGGGWLAVFKAANLRENLQKLLDGEAARQWMEKSAIEVRSLFSGKLGLVYQDGGIPADGVADYLKPGEWDELIARLSVIRPDNFGR